MKLGDGLFLNTFRRVAEDYKSMGIEFNDMIVDNTYGHSLFLRAKLIPI
jgi:isocitrate dehydrogenase (NAD+)